MLKVFDPRRVCLLLIILHFAVISAVCSRDTLSLVAHGYTGCPVSLQSACRTVERAIEAALGESLESSNPFRQGICTYTRLTGVDFGYGFFAPSVPDNYKLVFEMYYQDGHVEYELPRISTAGAGLRVSTLIDNIAQVRYDPLRELMVKMMAYAVWRQHPDATKVRAVLGFVMLPSATELRQGISESYQYLYAYDFEFSSPRNSPTPP